MTHEHTFEQHILLRTSFGAIAWVPLRAVIYPLLFRGDAWKCVTCGEQGYEIPIDGLKARVPE